MKTEGNRFRYYIDGVEVFDYDNFNKMFSDKKIKLNIINFDIYGETI